MGYSELPFGAIANAQILSGGYSAEFGRATGGVVNITTKSGTNRWEMGASVQWSPASMRAAERDTDYPNTGANPLTDGKLRIYKHANTTSSVTNSVFAGGPLVKDRLFMFAALEAQRVQSGAVNATSDTPVTTAGYTDTVSTTPRYLLKIDYAITDDHHLELTRIHDRTRTDARYFGFNYTTLQHDNVQKGGMHWVNCCGGADTGGDDTILKYTGYLSDDLTATALIGQSRTVHSQTPDGYDPTLRQTTSSAATRVPGLTYPNPQTFRGFFPADGSGDTQKAVRLDLEYVLGSHTLRAGIDTIRVASVVGNTSAGGGQWSYRKFNDPNSKPFGATESVAQGGGYGTQGYWVNFAVIGDASQPHSQQAAQYIEDRYQLGRNLLLSFGLRNEQFTNYNSSDAPVLSQRHQLAPRFGTSWDVNGDASFKLFANAGRYHLPLPTNVARFVAGNVLGTGHAYTYTGVDPATGAPTGLHEISGVVSVNNAFGQPKDPTQGVARDMKPLYQDELAFGFEKAFSPTMTAGVMFTYRTLRSTNDDWCDQRPIDAWGVRHHVDTSKFSFACAVINPGADNTLLLDLGGDGKLVRVDLTAADMGFAPLKRIYTALNIFAEHPLHNGWFGRINYTYSRSKGNSEGQVDSSLGGYVALTGNWDMREVMQGADGYLPNDHTHVFKAFGYTQLTPEWTLGTNLALTSGRPRNCFGNYPAALVAPGDTMASSYGSSYFYCNGVPSPRGSRGRLPWDVQLDMNLAYAPAIVKGLKLKADVANLLNRQTVLSQTETYNADDTISPSYQGVTGRAAPRALRLSAEFRQTF